MIRPVWKNIQPKWYFIGLIVAAILAALSLIPGPRPLVAPVDLETGSLVLHIIYSFFRMLLAYILALTFALVFGTLAATSRARARVILPVIDILQSVPLLGFFPTAIFWFMKIGSGSWGLECAVIFLIFTSQAWNLVFAVYDGIRSIPQATLLAVESFGLGPVAKFRRLYIPAVFPRIVDNSALSWSNGWYFLMACEIIALGSMSFEVQGIGALMYKATAAVDWPLFYTALFALFFVVLIMDFLVWRPLNSFAFQYRFDGSGNEASHSSDNLLTFYRNHWITAPLRKLLDLSMKLASAIENLLDDRHQPSQKTKKPRLRWQGFDLLFSSLFWVGVFFAFAGSAYELYTVLTTPQKLSPLDVLTAIALSGIRIIIAYIICLLWILPLSFYLHKHLRRLRWVQSAAQVLASIPATAFFPIIALLCFHVFESLELAVILMLLTGMQWYLLFNILGGAQNVGADLKDLGRALGLSKTQYLKKIFLPATAPALITGSITAIGGGWNALFLAEYIRIDTQVLEVFGIGSIISSATFEAGDRNLVAYAIFFMVVIIVTINKLFWQPVYTWAENKFRMDE